MIRCEDFSKICMEHGFTFFSGVPDSTFKSWMSYLENTNDLINIIAVNECEAAAICSGYHLSSGKIGVLYMQNDGFGKTVNPLTSLIDSKVYSIPILLMIGWRGEPGKKDAPQHKKMGEILIPLLKILEIPYKILPSNIKEIEEILKNAKEYMLKNNKPFAIIVRKGIFEDTKKDKEIEKYELRREDTIRTIIDCLDGNEIIISTTGKTSRELFEYRDAKKQGFKKDFYNIGAMGCAHSIALGIALEKKDKKVFVFDGDGAVLMQMGALATIGHYSPKNFYHVIFDNNSHDSTGGQPTCSDTTQFEKVALACNYKTVKVVETKKDLIKAIHELKNQEGPVMLVVKVKIGGRKDLGRPTIPPIELKEKFMKYLERS